MAKTAGKTRKITELLDPAFMAKLDGLDVLSHRVLKSRSQGERKSKRRGQSVEFADHRPYVVGDDLRFIDWNIYGRLEQLFLKLFMEEQDLTVNILIDASGSMAAPSPQKELYAKKLAAALGYISLVGNNRVSVSVFSDRIIRQMPNMRGRSCLSQFAELLLTYRSEGISDFENSCRQAASTRIGTGIMIVISDFFFKEGYTNGMLRLIGDKYELYVIQLLTGQEIEPEISGDLSLVDIEDNDVAEVTISSALLKYYKKNLSLYCNELKDFCVRRGGSYVLANTGIPIESLVLNYLRRIRLIK